MERRSFGAAVPTGSGPLPEVTTLHVLAGWGWRARGSGALQAEFGAMTGNRFMWMDIPKGEPGRIESEILIVPYARFELHVSSSVAVTLQTRFARTFTNPRWDTFDVGAGLSISHAMPNWLRRFLR